MLKATSPTKLQGTKVEPVPRTCDNVDGEPVHAFSTKSPKRTSASTKFAVVKTVPDRGKPITAGMPGTAANDSNRKSEVELVSERVSKTKKEIEQLKAQLQKLINDGMSKSDFTETKQNIATLNSDYKAVNTHNQPVSNSNKLVKARSEVDINRAKAFKDNVRDLVAPQHPVGQIGVPSRRKDKASSKQETNEESPKKIRHYDQEAAREYIKKQKEKRRDLMKNKKTEVEFTLDIKKQRLQELRQKSLQLVSKNIQHKRERSRSRSRDALDQPEVKHVETNGGKIAQVPKENGAQARGKTVNAESDLVPSTVKSKFELPTKQVKFAHPQLKNITVRSSMRDLSAIPRLDIPKHIQFNVDTPSAQVCQPIPLAELTPRNESTQLCAFEKQPKTVVEPTQSSGLVSNTEIFFTSAPSTQQSVLKKHKAAIKIQAAFRGYRQKKLYQLALKVKQKFKEQATKEVQTVEIKDNTPIWLQAPTALPYPYNFISTVKRKLNLAVQQIATTNDVAVQSSLVQENVSDKTEKSSKQKNSPNKNTDLKSFLSHKCLDLDVKAIEPLVLTRNSSLHDKNVTLHDTRPNTISKPELNGFASDSDTSKNIPEISSESSVAATSKQHSSKRSRSSDTDHDDRPKINMDRVKRLKLLRPKQLNFSTESAKSQNSKLSEEISEHISGANSGVKARSRSSFALSTSVAHNDYSGRDSIIASNKCDYSQSKTKNHADISNSVELSRLKLSEHKAIESLIPPQDALNSFRSYMKSLDNEKDVANSNSNIKTQISSEKSLKKPENLITIRDSVEKSQKTPGDVTNMLSTVSSSVLSKLCTEASDSNKTTHRSSKKPSEKSERKISPKTSEISLAKHSHSEKRESTITTHNSGENPQEYSSSFTSVRSTVSPSVPLLTHPNVSLRSSRGISSSEGMDVVDDGKAITSITLRPGERTAVESRVKSNEIHLKFEAELHLLNEFNDSLRQVMAMEKSLLHLHNNSSNVPNAKTATTYQTRDTQTSFVTKSPTDTKITMELSQDVPENQHQIEPKTQGQIPTINYSRGSEVSEQMDIFGLESTIMETNDTSLVTTGLELSQIKDNVLTSSVEESNVDVSVSFTRENCYNNGNGYRGLSIEMFEQLIRDEDARIENLKTILKIREKALVDRTKGELAWLEIQKKHLRDSGQLQEISTIKKKQRGLLIKLEHERHEMQRLKQMQKAASKERKSVLREQRNMIKAQLSNTSNMITKIKRNTKEERRQSGPLKVYNIKSHSESIRSETSMSRRSSGTEEIISVVSHSQSIVSHVTEEAMISGEKMQQRNVDVAPLTSGSQIKTEHVKRSLLMREAALQKRRKAAEELLQWHQRLVEEEGKIAELERAASAIINQVPTVTNSMVSDEATAEKHKFKGSQLNLLWYNMTGREEKKFDDHVTYSMSKISLERFCKDAKKYAMGRNKSFHNKKGGKISDSDSSLSAIDVTVTELTQSKNNSRNLKNSTSSEKSKKSKFKNSHFTSEIASQNIVSNSKTKDSQDYTSDFESLLSVNKESELITVAPDDEQKGPHETTLVSREDQSEVSKLSSAEISLSDKDNIETVAEKSKTVDLSNGNKTNDSEIDEKELSVNEVSLVEIIDDNSTFDDFHYSKKVSDRPSDSVPENLEIDVIKISTAVMENASEKLVEDLAIIPSEANGDSTSKDITTDIENDENRSEIVEPKNGGPEEIIKSVSHKEEMTSQAINSESNNLISSKHSLNKTAEEVVSTFESKLSDPVWANKTNDEEVLSGFKSQSVDVEKDKVSEKVQSSNRTGEDDMLSKTSEDQPIQTDEDNLLSETDKSHLPSEIEEDQLLDNTSKEQLCSKTNEEQPTETEDELSVKTDQDPLLSGINKMQLLSKTNKNQLLETKDDHMLSETNESRMLRETNGSQSSSRTDKDEDWFSECKDRLFSQIDEDQQLTVTEEQLPSKTGENLSKTDNDELIKTNGDQSLNKSDGSELLSKTNEGLVKSSENELLTDINTNQSLTKTDDEISSKANEDQHFSGEGIQVNIHTEAEVDELPYDKPAKTSYDKQDGKISFENELRKLDTDTSGMKTVESDSDTEVVSDEEWNKLSAAGDNQELNKGTGNFYNVNVPEVDENLKQVEEGNSINISSISISEKSESPLLLSYGFVEEKTPNGQTKIKGSPSGKDHVEETVEDTSARETSVSNENSDADLSEREKYLEHEKLEISKSQASENYLEEGKFGDNVNQTYETSTDLVENKESKDDLNQTFEHHLQNTQFENYLNQSPDGHEEEKLDTRLNQTYEVDLKEKTGLEANASYEDNETTNSHNNLQKRTTNEVEQIDVKKRVSEILADANIQSPREDKSPRLQDLYVTAYDVVSPEHSSSSGSPTDDIDQTFMPPGHIYRSEEVEELLKKQLEIEQEIKEIQQQQQKEHVPYLYVREIPNKPPPPYTPPATIQAPVTGSVLPASEKQIGIITKSAADILYKAYLDKNLQNVTLSAEDEKMMQSRNNVDKNCFEFVFDLCKEAAIDHYKQFETETGPSWMHLTKRSKLAIGKPFDRNGLEKFITTKVRQWLGYEIVKSAENIKRKWSGKKRDHVDELLVVECQAEESEWTNYDRDELIVKDELTKDIMNMLLSETAQVFNNILNKKTFLC